MTGAAPDTENMGIGAALLEFGRWGWAFRGQYVKDYGIDAHAEPFDGPHQPTGRLLALQIKSAIPTFREEVAGGWWYRGENKHLRYWLGHVLPVLIVMYDPVSNSLFWQHVTEDRVEYTDGEWKILIPRDQVLSVESAAQLREIQLARQLVITDLATAGEVIDGHQAWLSAVELAAERQLPLWSDDVAVRSIAASQNITTFGTWALLKALIELQLMSDSAGEDGEILAAEGIVELPSSD